MSEEQIDNNSLVELQQNYLQQQLMNQQNMNNDKTEEEQEYEQQLMNQQILQNSMEHQQFQLQNQMVHNQIQYYVAPPNSLPNNYLNELNRHWADQYKSIENTKAFKRHKLPLARIKKIMKSDEDVRMISAEAPILFAKACEMFIIELTIRSWIHTEEGKRRTLQRNDIASAISKTDIFDFLIDIVPRDDGKPTKKELQQGRIISPQELASQQYMLYLAQQHALQQHQNEEGGENNNENNNNENSEPVYQIGNEMYRYLQL
jgi:nuclear transcription factor Y, gamma